MSRHFACFCWLVLAATAMADVPQDRTEGQVAKILNKHFDADGPGVAVFLRNGERRYQTGFGLADIDRKMPIDPVTTVFDVASVTKPFTAIAILILCEEGKLTLDDPVGKHLPKLKLAERGRPVTIRDLLWHRSGLADYSESFRGSDRAFQQLDMRGHLAWLGRQKSIRTPGKRFEYNNSGYVLLASVIAAVSGQSYAKFVGERILGPCKMTRSTVVDDFRRKAPGLATGYKTKGKKREATNASLPMSVVGDGNLFSTVVDLARFENAMLQHRIVSEKILKKAFSAGQMDNGQKTDYGFGWNIDDAQTVSHEGGWMGTSSSLKIHHSTRRIIILLSNDENANLANIESELLATDLFQQD